MRRSAVALAVVVVIAAAAVGLVLALRPDEGSAGPPDPVTVSPVPGGRWASPETEISLRGLPPARLGSIEVSGSESGRHAGRLEPHFDNEGASFVPDEPFEPGEEVEVSTELTVPGGRDGDYRFWVSRPAPPPPPRTAERPGGAVRRYATAPGLVTPAVEILRKAPGRTRGYTFIAPKRGSGIDGPMILNDEGDVVWARAAPEGEEIFDFRPQRYKGEPVLTWWEGTSTVGVGAGEGVMLDTSYREVMRIRAGNGYRADLHEMLVTPRGTALLIAYPYVHADLRAVGGPRDGMAIDGVVQEVDLETGHVLFEWHSLDHVGLEESHWPLPEDPRTVAYDYAHLNSVAIDDDGDLLVNARHTWAAYKIDRRTGTVRWRLGGKKSDFELADGAAFAYQHDVRRRADGAITLFDNAASQAPQPGKRSRGLALELDEGAGTARVADEYPNGKLLGETQGNMQTLPGGHVFVGWGAAPAFTEFAPDGRIVLAGRIAEGNDNYRAYRAPWTGRPTDPPALVVRGRDAIASFNGATGVDRWMLLAGPRPGALRAAGSSARQGFETRLRVPAGARVVAVRALGPRGGALGESEPVTVAR
jgi:hypothetical protein